MKNNRKERKELEINAEIEVKQNIQEVWEFLANPINSPKWDRSIDSVKLITNNSLRVGSVVETTSPNGMVQSWKVTEYRPNNELKFLLLESKDFKYAELAFKLTSTSNGTLIKHQLVLKFKFKHLFLYPLLLITNKKALRRDFNALETNLNKIYS